MVLTIQAHPCGTGQSQQAPCSLGSITPFPVLTCSPSPGGCSVKSADLGPGWGLTDQRAGGPHRLRWAFPRPPPQEAAGVLSWAAGVPLSSLRSWGPMLPTQCSSNDQKPKDLDMRPFFPVPFLKRNELQEQQRKPLQSWCVQPRCPQSPPPCAPAQLHRQQQLSFTVCQGLRPPGLTQGLEEWSWNNLSSFCAVWFVSK